MTTTTTTKPPEVWISAINDDRGIVLARTANEELVAQVHEKTRHGRWARARDEAANKEKWGDHRPTVIGFMIPDPPSAVLTAKYIHSAVVLLVGFDSSGKHMELGRCTDNDFACEMLDKITELG
jgi:hypothetical protein